MARILIVEDDEFLQQIYSDTLRGAGYDVDSAYDGEVALKKIQEGGWDIILIDIIIPKINGLEVIQKAKETAPAEPNKKIVFLTNLDKGEEIERAKELGEGYIIKSQINPGDLVEKVNSLLVDSERVVD